MNGNSDWHPDGCFFYWIAYLVQLYGHTEKNGTQVSIILLLCMGTSHMVLMGMDGKTWWTYPAGIVFAVPFFIAWLRSGMGAGDVKLVIAISLYLGLLNMIMAFILMVPVLLGLMVRSWRKNKTLKCRIPFAPVLSLGVVGSVLIGYLYALTGI